MSQAITVFVERVGHEWCPWRVLASSAHLPWPIEKYLLKRFRTEAEAAEYGFEAAKFKIDSPPPQSGRKEERRGCNPKVN
jgi:hypothetical protein